MTNFRPVSPHLSVYSPQNSSGFSITFRISGLFLSFFTLFICYFSLLFPFLLFPLSLISPIVSFFGFFLLAFLIFHFIALYKPNI